MARWLLWAAILLRASTTVAAEANNEPLTIRVGFLVTSISGLDFVNGSFSVQTYVWFVDPRGDFDPTTDIKVLARTATLEKAEERTLADGARYTAVRLQATVDQSYDVSDFPFDSHVLRLPIETLSASDELRLEPDTRNTRLADFTSLPDWTIRGLRLENRSVLYDTGLGLRDGPTSSRLSLLMDVERRQRFMLVIERFIGFIMALMITALVYFVPADQLGVRVGMVTSAIFVTVGNRYSLDTVLGVDAAFGLVDQLSLITFASIYVALAVSLIASRMRQSRGVAVADLVDRWTATIVVPLFAVLAIGALVHAQG